FLRTHHHGLRAGGNQRGHAVGGRRGVAEVTDHGATTLNLLRTDEICRFDDAWPLLLDGALAELDTRNRGTDLEARRGLLDGAHRLDALDVDDEVRLDVAALHAHEEIGSAGENRRFASFFCEKCNRGLGRAGCFVSHYILSTWVVWRAGHDRDLQRAVRAPPL